MGASFAPIEMLMQKFTKFADRMINIKLIHP
jgi:hypothetical protein